MLHSTILRSLWNLTLYALKSALKILLNQFLLYFGDKVSLCNVGWPPAQVLPYLPNTKSVGMCQQAQLCSTNVKTQTYKISGAFLKTIMNIWRKWLNISHNESSDSSHIWTYNISISTASKPLRDLQFWPEVQLTLELDEVWQIWIHKYFLL